MAKALPIGYEDFREIIEKNLYYVDKTLMIKELIDGSGKVNLITRPRRFGKTLNLSMLRYFFEKERDSYAYLFKGLNICACDEKYWMHQGKYPVINLSLKSSRQPDFEMAQAALKEGITAEYRRHDYIIECGKLSEEERQKYSRIMEGKGSSFEYAASLLFLSYCLENYYENKVIVLIDEYDVPLENAYYRGFYDEMADFIRSLFESALKTNAHLEFAVITGCLRISRESIFTGLNNLKIHSVLTGSYADDFGFTQEEVEKALEFYGLEDKVDEVRRWYDGYRFGNEEIYNPWSILNYIDTALIEPEAFPKPYWSNTSSNQIIRDLVEKADMETKKEIELLIAGGTIEKPVHEDITYGDIYESKDNLWNFLFFTGYLKKCGESMEGRNIYLSLGIPNEEIVSIYENTVLNWFHKKIETQDLTPLITAIENGDCDTLGELISAQLADTISFFDYAENYYHGFLAGLLKGAGRYEVLSNRESGIGRSDIVMKEPRFRGRAVVFEIKVAYTFLEMEEKCREALRQIEDKNYESELIADGYSEVLKYGLCFYKKGCIAIRNV